MVVKQIICINWGTKYGALYVNRLYGMVARNVTPPFTFTCFTDNSDGFRDEVDAVPLPALDFVLPVTRSGVWQKCRLWNERLAGLTGVVLFLDLDLVVTGNLDGFFAFGEQHDVVMAKDPSAPFRRYGQTSIYRFPVGKLLPLLTMFAEAPLAIAEQYRYEQRYVTHHAPGGVTFWPRPWVLHFRRHCRRAVPLNYFLTPKLPATCKIVIFPADPKPTDAIVGRYYSGDPIRTPIEHVKAGVVRGGKRSLMAHLRHYILPTPWVASHWKE